MVGEHRLGRGDVRGPLPPLKPLPRPAFEAPSARRLRAPLALIVGALLAFEALGGLVILFVRVAWGATPGLVLHVVAGLALTLAYAAYQVGHWGRIAPWRARPDYALGLIAALTMIVTNGTGLALSWIWWRDIGGGAAARYPVALSALHTLGTMLVLTFVAAHLAAVLQRQAGTPPR